jgi:hypothetical protein
MTSVKLVCSLGCTLMLVAGVAYAAFLALRRPSSASGPGQETDAAQNPDALGAGTGATTP